MLGDLAFLDAAAWAWNALPVSSYTEFRQQKLLFKPSSEDNQTLLHQL